MCLSFLLLLNCSDKKKTSETSETETTATVKDSIPTKDAVKEIDAVVSHYICYTNDKKPSLELSIAFNAAGNALFAKYKGQQDSIPLQNVKEDFKNDGAYPTITQLYEEIYNGKKNGTYELTHAGNWDYAKYTRQKDGKVFLFTINHDLTVTGNGYRETPCF
ncbi:hypothetical protein KAOT1_20262 [Kordia algicida OT-1]|uniref:Uncharacterized protein n=2 Tax=Kordia TaxID=221065 RepID=A9DPV8_9FLAO|nr:hypothetical protein KAOT1_20262 [Kordia algicida OT-1]